MPTSPAPDQPTTAPASAEAREYVVSVPTGYQAAAGRFRDALRALDAGTAGVPVLASAGAEGDKLVRLTDDEARRFRVRFPSLTLEPNIRYRKARHPLLERFRELTLTAQVARTAALRVVDAATGAPVAEATVFALVDEAGVEGFSGRTGADGRVTFRVSDATARFAAVVVFPAAGYWNRRVRDVPAVPAPAAAPDLAVPDLAVTPLPPLAPEQYDWGHQFSGMADGAGEGGRRVRVAVIDTGIRRDHPDLRPAGGRNCVFGEPEEDWWRDEDGHGTHCAGVIAALLDGSGVKGYAPAVELRAYRVFAAGGEGATTFDIATAIQRALDDGCDVLSMSLGSPAAQSAIRTKIELAYDRGALCVAATGNDGGPVSFPAAFPNVLGVGAFGRFGSYPADSLHAEVESATTGAGGALFLASFSNFGLQEVDFCAPGVAVRSTVPGGYAAWDGTSMACPQVAGMAALALAARPELLGAPRDAERADQLERVLRAAARPLGFGAQFEGAGALDVGRLAAAPNGSPSVVA